MSLILYTLLIMLGIIAGGITFFLLKDRGIFHRHEWYITEVWGAYLNPEAHTFLLKCDKCGKLKQVEA